MIAIKGKEMPKSCMTCQFHDQMYNRCNIGHFETGAKFIKGDDKWYFKHPNCPLVEIVTCKECKYNVKNGYNTTTCDIGHRFYMRDHNTFYCADGARKEEPRDSDDTFVNGLPRSEEYFEERRTGNPDFCNG